jgi:hypothetical protein
MAGRKGKLIESKYTVEEVCDILTRFGGLVYPSARHMGVSRNALVKYIDRHAEAKKAMEHGREQTIDKAESVILRAVEGSLPGCSSRDMIDAAKILLMQLERGRRRGYGEKITQEVNSNQPIVINRAVDEKWG